MMHSTNKEEVENSLPRWKDMRESRGFNINVKKVIYINMRNQNVNLGSKNQEKWTVLDLCSTLSKNGEKDQEITDRTNARKVCYATNVKSEGFISKTVMGPAMLYGTESWLKKIQEKMTGC